MAGIETIVVGIAHLTVAVQPIGDGRHSTWVESCFNPGILLDRTRLCRMKQMVQPGKYKKLWSLRGKEASS